MGQRRTRAEHGRRRARAVHLAGRGRSRGRLGGDLMRRAAALLATVAALVLAGSAAAAPPRLSQDRSQADVASTYGSGSFGGWGVDRFGLPYYSYETDEAHDPKAAQQETAGKTGAPHQVGNDHIVAAAFNDGYTQFWSQDRLSQWGNDWQPASRHYAGGFGWLNVDGKVASTLY